MVDVVVAATQEGARRSATALLSRSESEIPRLHTLSWPTRPVLEAFTSDSRRAIRTRTGRGQRNRRNGSPPCFRRNESASLRRPHRFASTSQYDAAEIDIFVRLRLFAESAMKSEHTIPAYSRRIFRLEIGKGTAQ